MGDRNASEILGDLLTLYDNVRSDYSTSRKLEIGGVAVSRTEIKGMVAKQAACLARSALGMDGISICWAAESARLYAQDLRSELRKQYHGPVRLDEVKTAWSRNYTANVVRAASAPIIMNQRSRHLTVAMDLLVGSGATMRALDTWCRGQGAIPDKFVTLVNMVNHHKPYGDLRPGVPHFASPTREWLLGYHSDCPADGRPRGRGIPFIAFLVPEGEGIRAKLAELSLGAFR